MKSGTYFGEIKKKAGRDFGILYSSLRRTFITTSVDQYEWPRGGNLPSLSPGSISARNLGEINNKVKISCSLSPDPDPEDSSVPTRE